MYSSRSVGGKTVSSGPGFVFFFNVCMGQCMFVYLCVCAFIVSYLVLSRSPPVKVVS